MSGKIRFLPIKETVPPFRFYDMSQMESVTKQGRCLMTELIEKAKEMGFKVTIKNNLSDMSDKMSDKTK